MKHVFFATLIIVLTLITPAYISFIVCTIYLLSTGVPPVWLFVLGVVLDSVYGYRFNVFGHLIPLYASLSVFAFFVIKTVIKRFSFIS